MAYPITAADPTTAQLKSMFQRIQLSTDAAMELVIGQGIDSIEEIMTLTQDLVTRLCSIISKPEGGTDGHVVSEPAETLFQLLVYYCQHQYHVIWGNDHSLVTLVNLHALLGQHELEKDWDLTITEYVKPVFKDMTKTFDMLEELISNSRGASEVPLNYVIRNCFSPADGVENPGYNYTSKDTDMILHAPILLVLGVGDEEMGLFNDIFQIKQNKVYYILFAISSATEAWLYSKTSYKDKQGRKLLLALYAHYLGSNKVDHLSESLTTPMGTSINTRLPIWSSIISPWDWKYTASQVLMTVSKFDI